MIYLKNFNKENDYLTYRDGCGYGKPNVSLSIDGKAVHYNYPPLDTNGFDFVNLKLPSGTLWATKNVGASTPTDYGLYFQWGDTVGYTAEQIGKDKKFTETDYKWLSGETYTKYTGYGATLDLEDDAAHVHMGGDWHMPTPTQINELINETTNTWTRQDGMNGRLFTSKVNGKSIFIPAAGYASDGSLSSSQVDGSVWSSMLSTYNAIYGQFLIFDPGFVNLNYYDRYSGRSVRGVIG